MKSNEALFTSEDFSSMALRSEDRSQALGRLPAGDPMGPNIRRIIAIGCAPVKCVYHLVMTNSLPWKITMLLIGKPSISMGHAFHGYVK